MAKYHYKISVVSPTIRGLEALKTIESSLKSQTFTDFEWLVDIGRDGNPGLNRALNGLIRGAKGELVVFAQDYLVIDPDGLHRFWEAYKKHSDTLFTAPMGHLGKDGLKWDWRDNTNTEFNNNLPFTHWEIDWGAAPREILYRLGGFDERLDTLESWYFGNVNMGLRATLAGVKIMNLVENQAVGREHKEFMQDENRKAYDPKIHNQLLDELRRGIVPAYL